jgi:NurA-like 5'-3' nuclease
MAEQNQTEDKKQQMKAQQEKTRKMLEEHRMKIMDELSKQPEGDEPQYPPEIVERINQILNDAAASLPPGPTIAAQPETRPEKILDRANEQIEKALAQYPHCPDAVKERVKGVLGSRPVEQEDVPEPEPTPWAEPQPAPQG